jgi:hypothetical protein
MTCLLNCKLFLIFLMPLPEEQMGVIKIDASFPSDCISVQLVTCKAVSCDPFECRVWPFCSISTDILSIIASVVWHSFICRGSQPQICVWRLATLTEGFHLFCVPSRHFRKMSQIGLTIHLCHFANYPVI